MWKSSQPLDHSPISISTPPPAEPSILTTSPPARSLPHASPLEQSTIGKGLTFKGEVTGSNSLFIDGRVEGSVNIPGERVTIGQNGYVVAGMSTMRSCITAREIVIMGKVIGNVTASDRVEIRSEGTLTGDVSTLRISIADGAYFRGGVDIRKTDGRLISVAEPMPSSFISEARPAVSIDVCLADPEDNDGAKTA